MVIPYHDKPMADHGLTSYRYRGSYSWIMIGAPNIADALRSADRSLSVKGATTDRLEIWCDESRAYVPALCSFAK